jgi:hypothetical protein
MRRGALVGLVMLLAAVQALRAQESWLGRSEVERWSRGKFVYRKLSTGQENGQEEFLLVVDRDGVRTLRATNAFIDHMEIWRHVVFRVDQRFRPLDVYLDYHVDGRWRGSGLFIVGKDSMRAMINSPQGVREAVLPVPERFSLIPHPISSNSWPAWYYDRKQGGRQPVTLYSFDGQARDADGMLGAFQQQTIALKGTETLRLPAGEFPCDWFEFNDGDPLICLFGPDQLIAKMVWKRADVEYLLSEYATGPPRADGGE